MADRQGVVLSRLNRLEDRLFELSKMLQRSEPEHAARLQDALATGRKLLLRHRVEQIIADLRSSKLPDAADAQKRLVVDLESLLGLLIDDAPKPEDLAKEMEDLKALRERLQQLLKEQEAELSAAEQAARTEAQLERIRGELRALGEMLKQQQQLSNDRDVKSAGPQRELSKRAEKSAERLSSTDKPEAAPTEAMKDAADKTREASGDMSKAAEELSAGDAEKKAGDSQKKAEEKLQRAIERLQEEQKALQEKLDYLRQAEAQRDTAAKTAELAKRMQAGKTPGQEGQQGQPGEPQPQGESPLPDSAKQLDEAAPHQQKAAEELNERDPKKAADQQRQALEKMKKAQEQLEEALEQLRREQQEEMLAALETRFAAMLARQQTVNTETNRLDSTGQEKWTRTDQLAVVETAKSQGWVGDEADAALKILKEDGTTIVVPRLVEQVRDDARDAARRIGSNDVATVTRQIQESIVITLQELLESVREMRKQNQNQQADGSQSPPGSSDQTPPLLPGSAELKLLRSCQVRINKTTEQIARQGEMPGSSPAELRERIDQTARRQADIAQMARDLSEGEQSRDRPVP